MDLVAYKHLTGQRLGIIMENYDIQTLDIIVGRTNQILKETVIECSLPQARKRKYKWEHHLKPLAMKIRSEYDAWKREGKPRNSKSSTLMRLNEAKKDLRRGQRQIIAKERHLGMAEIMDAPENTTSCSTRLYSIREKAPMKLLLF
jgi:hypothetical protein